MFRPIFHIYLIATSNRIERKNAFNFLRNWKCCANIEFNTRDERLKKRHNYFLELIL